MRGLIIKDALTLKSTWKNLIVMLIGSLLISYALANYTLAIITVPMALLTSGMNTFQTDEFYNTESYTLSYPLSRKEIILSKYLFTIILLLISSYIGLMIYYLVGITIHPGYNGLNVYMIKYFFMLEAGALIVDSIFYPVIYKYGCEKSRLVLMSIVMLFLGIGAIASVYINTEHIQLDLAGALNFVQTYGIYIIGILVIIFMIISYILSNIFYKHKDY